MGTDVAFACRCGTVRGRLTEITRRAGTRIQCHCRDCRAAVMWSGDPDPGSDGVAYFQTTPDRIHFEAGQDRIAPVVWRGNIYRWQATCCGSFLFNTATTPGMPFASAYVARFDPADAFGRVVGHAFLPKPGGGTRHTGTLAFLSGLFSRSLAARLSGRWKETPFFDLATRKPVADPLRLGAEERRAGRPG